jgi:hypothetical protein
MTAAKRAAYVRGAILYIGPITPERLGEGWEAFARELCAYPGFAVLGLEVSTPPLAPLPRAATEVALGWLDETPKKTPVSPTKPPADEPRP